jgi:hypothetical protein
MFTSKFQRIGLVFAFFHLSCFVLFYVYVNILSSGKEQIQLLWMYWIVIDFPASLFLILIFLLNGTSSYAIYFTHGIIGTLWWYYLPIIISSFINKFKRANPEDRT